MIVPMKKVTLLCLEQDKARVLAQLRGLGVMQLQYAKTPDSADVASLVRRIGELTRAEMAVASAEPREPRGPATKLTGRAAAGRVLELLSERSSAEKNRDEALREREQLLPWGEFRLASLEDLRGQGLFPYLCAVQTAEFAASVKAFPADTAVAEISRDKSTVYFLAVASSELDPEAIGAVTLPARPLSEIEGGIRMENQKLDAIADELYELKSALDSIRAYSENVRGELEFAEARDGMAADGAIAWIFGYVPETELEKLRAAAKKDGMALRIEDPAADDEQVPTYIVKPKFLNIMDPLFDFIGVTPGYRENDVNLFFLLFFPVFFGMIIGDAGYGTIFLVCALVCKRIFRQKASARLPLNLFLLLSIFALTWGWLFGSWCGIPRSVLPGFMRGWDFLADPGNSPLAHRFAKSVGLISDDMPANDVINAMGGFKNKFIQFFCFILAALHLVSARIFRFVVDVRRTWRAFGHLGWALLLAANAMLAIHLIVFPGFFPAWGQYLYITGFVLVVATISAQASLNLPFSLVGSFVDVLSYIRLFAVGLAGAYISEKFNDMGLQLMHSFTGVMQVLGVVFLILVAVFGNVLNIALGFLSVLVHAIRLNTLEFSNHIEMQWSGLRFHPFKKPDDNL